MKNLKFIALFALIIGFVSCSSDDDKNSFSFNKENLIGSHSLKAFSSEEIRKDFVNGFLVETKTTREGDTFGLQYDFGTDNRVTLNGTFRITQLKRQGSNTSDTTYIVNYNNEKLVYSVDADQKVLTIDGNEYDVKKFREGGFELSLLQETTEGQNSKVYKEEMRFTN